MKKGICVFLIIVIIVGCLPACAEPSVSKSAVIEGAVFSGMSSDKIPVTVSFDTDWLTKRDNSTYDPELAQFCALLSADSYFREKDYLKQRQNRVLFNDFNETDYDLTSFLSVVGFSQTEHYESYLSMEDPTDSNDSVTLTIGYQSVDGKYDVYAVVVRGCFSVQEWRSAFDPGCGSTKYEEITGEHPEWTNNNHLKGADVAANRAFAYIEDFMKKNGDDSLPDRILITGHSRGGGIANILGAYFENDESVTSYTYTFNAMSVTSSDDAKDYKTIFNVFDSGDFFTETFPFENEIFARYGTDMSMSVSGSDKISQTLAELKGRNDYTCVPADVVEEYRSLFAQRFPDRDMLYDKETITRIYGTREEAVSDREEFCKTISSEEGLGLDDLCTVSEITEENNGTFSLTIEYCGAALLRTYAMILAYGETAYTPAVKLFGGDEAGCGIAGLIFENAAGINGGHLLINSYVIAGNLK